VSKRVLVIEDEALIALDIARELTDAGFEVVGMATSVAKALRLVGEVGCDVAVLDINLGAETSEPIAQELRARGIPFVLLSGASTPALSSAFKGAPQLSKPVRLAALLAELRNR